MTPGERDGEILDPIEGQTDMLQWKNHSLKKSLHITQPKIATAPQVAKNVTGGSQPLGSRPGFGPVRTGDLSGDLVQPQNAGENATVDVDFK